MIGRCCAILVLITRCLLERNNVGSPHERTHNTASAAENVVQAQHVHGDVHIHGAAGSHVVPRQLPAAVRHFINRTVEQDALTTLLNGAGSDNTVFVSTVDGLAGVGKSTLVVQWAHQARERFPDGELYVNLRGFDPAADPMTSAEALAIFLTALGVAPEAVPASEEARQAQFRTLVHGKRMLLVLDNARDTEQVRPLLPGSPSNLVVVTSRQRLDGLVAHHGAQRLALATLTRDEGRHLVACYLGDERLAAERDAVAELLEHCAGLPLALTLVAVQAAADPEVPLRDLATELRDERDRLDVLDAGGRTGIRAVFSWSYQTLSPEAARLFRLLGLPNSPDVSIGAATALAGTELRRVRRILAELCRAQLITRHAGDRYAFHDLLRAYARERAQADDSDEEQIAALQRLLDHYLYAIYGANHQLAPSRPLPELEHTDPSLWQDFATHEDVLNWWDAECASVLATIRQSVKIGLPRGPWLAHAATYPFKLRGFVAELLISSLKGLEGARRNGDRPLEARLLADCSVAHYFHGELDAAATYQQSASQLYGELDEPRWVADTLGGLASIFLQLERYTDAVESARQALRVRDEADAQGFDDGLANAVLGLALAHLGDFDSAFTHVERTLDSSADQFLRGYALTNLGSVHLLVGDVDNAVLTYRRAVEHRRSLGQQLGEAVSLTKLGEALKENGEIEEARQAWQTALAIFEKIGHSDAAIARSHVDKLDAEKPE